MAILKVIAALPALLVLVGNLAHAQEFWVQIEARPNEAQARSRIEALQSELARLEGFALRTGWYALALGPYDRSSAEDILSQLRLAREIPADSFIADGSQFVRQFWPPEGSQLALANPDEAAPAPLPEAGPSLPVETLAEARRSEALLSREEKMDLQSALAWAGYYDAAIDGAIGRGSRNAMAAWQTARGYEATGILTSAERGLLLDEFQSVLDAIGLAPFSDAEAGIDIELPLAIVEPDGSDAPFVHFAPRDDSGVRVELISQSGDRASLAALFEVMQTLEMVPRSGPRRLSRDSFTLTGEDAEMISTTYAVRSGDDVKGFTLIWPQGDEKRRALVLARMRDSFQPVPGRVLPDPVSLTAGPSADALAGLTIRRPAATQTGFFVDPRGNVLTSSAGLDECARITLWGEDDPAEIVASDPATGLAILRPDRTVAPMAYAHFSSIAPRPGAEIALAGFSYGGRLGAASVSFGRLDDVTGLNGDPDQRQLALPAQPGDTGGPVADRTGAVVGMLLPAKIESGRELPDDVHFARSAAAIDLFLTDNGVAAPVQSSGAGILRPLELGKNLKAMTVLVQCWD